MTPERTPKRAPESAPESAPKSAPESAPEMAPDAAREGPRPQPKATLTLLALLLIAVGTQAWSWSVLAEASEEAPTARRALAAAVDWAPRDPSLLLPRLFRVAPAAQELPPSEEVDDERLLSALLVDGATGRRAAGAAEGEGAGALGVGAWEVEVVEVVEEVAAAVLYQLQTASCNLSSLFRDYILDHLLLSSMKIFRLILLNI